MTNSNPQTKTFCRTFSKNLFIYWKTILLNILYVSSKSDFKVRYSTDLLKYYQLFTNCIASKTKYWKNAAHANGFIMMA